MTEVCISKGSQRFIKQNILQIQTPALKDEQYSLPKIAGIFATLAKGQKFSKIDITQAYLKIEVHPDHRKYFTINTAPAKWQRAIEQVLEGLECVQVILDDMIITGSNDSEEFGSSAPAPAEFGLRANMAKCVFFKDRIEFCVHSVNRNGLH